MNPWIQYTGEYLKTFCSIITKDGKEYGLCYPNAGTFHVLEKNGEIIDGDEVDKIYYWTEEEIEQWREKQ